MSQSLSKHSTYNFNPDYLPLIPAWAIASAEATIDALYAEGVYDEGSYLFYQALLSDNVYGCVVERSPIRAATLQALESTSANPITVSYLEVKSVSEDPGGQTNSGSNQNTSGHQSHFARNVLIGVGVMLVVVIIIAVAARK